jgi:DNA-binding response OmpR family regulator
LLLLSFIVYLHLVIPLQPITLLTMAILVCEDETKVRSFIVNSFRTEGYPVFESSNLEDLLQVLRIESQVKVLILDRLLGNQDSSFHISEIKNLSPKLQILVLSAIDTPEQKAKILDLGAHDYLSKPFRLVELQARVRALVRRFQINPSEPQNTLILEYKDIRIDKLKHRTYKNNSIIDLSNKEYQLLLTMIDHPGRVYNKYQLLDTVWSSQFDIESNVVEVTIKNLRKKLISSGSEVTIESRRQVGYWIEE